jgi:signal peptidase I
MKDASRLKVVSLETISASAAIWLLEHLAPPYRREALAGDLMEEFHHRRSLIRLWSRVLQAISLRMRPTTPPTGGHGPAGRRVGRAGQYWRDYRGTLAFLILMLGFRSAWADWVYVPSGSMNPTIIEGDRLLVDKHVYGLRIPFTLVRLTRGEDPRRGDIVTFDSPVDGTLLVKRVIGVPGDVIAMSDERLTVNGIPDRYMPAGRRDTRSLLLATQAEHPQAWGETAGNCMHDILLLQDRPSPSTFGPIVVPPGMYFMLGDNRDNSADSRYIGFVPRRNVVGRATEILMSFNPDRYHLPRTRRYLIPLNCRR